MENKSVKTTSESSDHLIKADKALPKTKSCKLKSVKRFSTSICSIADKDKSQSKTQSSNLNIMSNNIRGIGSRKDQQCRYLLYPRG